MARAGLQRYRFKGSSDAERRFQPAERRVFLFLYCPGVFRPPVSPRGFMIATDLQGGSSAAGGRLKIEAPPQIEWVDYRCRAEFIRPTAMIATGDKEVATSCDALRRGPSFH